MIRRDHAWALVGLLFLPLWAYARVVGGLANLGRETWKIANEAYAECKR